MRGWPGSRRRAPGYGWSIRIACRSIPLSQASSSVGEKLQGVTHQGLRVTAAVGRQRLAQGPVGFDRRVPEPLERVQRRFGGSPAGADARRRDLLKLAELVGQFKRSEEHTSELQSRSDLVC